MVESRIVIPVVVGSNPISHPNAKVAHQVEHQTENLGVVGSSPTLGTSYSQLAQW